MARNGCGDVFFAVARVKHRWVWTVFLRLVTADLSVLRSRLANVWSAHFTPQTDRRLDARALEHLGRFVTVRKKV